METAPTRIVMRNNTITGVIRELFLNFLILYAGIAHQFIVNLSFANRNRQPEKHPCPPTVDINSLRFLDGDVKRFLENYVTFFNIFYKSNIRFVHYLRAFPTSIIKSVLISYVNLNIYGQVT